MKSPAAGCPVAGRPWSAAGPVAADTIKAKRVVRDTSEVLFSALANQTVVHSELIRLFRWLKEKGVTVVMTGERVDGTLTRCDLEEYVSIASSRSTNGWSTKTQAPHPRGQVSRHDAWDERNSLPPVSRMEEPAIGSRSKLLDNCDGDETLLGRLVALFRENTPRLLADLRAAIDAGEASELARAAHALLSSLGAFGATPAHAEVRRLEYLGESEELTGASEIFAALEREMVRVFAALDELSGVAT